MKILSALNFCLLHWLLCLTPRKETARFSSYNSVSKPKPHASLQVARFNVKIMRLMSSQSHGEIGHWVDLSQNACLVSTIGLLEQLLLPINRSAETHFKKRGLVSREIELDHQPLVCRVFFLSSPWCCFRRKVKNCLREGHLLFPNSIISKSQQHQQAMARTTAKRKSESKSSSKVLSMSFTCPSPSSQCHPRLTYGRCAANRRKQATHHLGHQKTRFIFKTAWRRI